MERKVSIKCFLKILFFFCLHP